MILQILRFESDNYWQILPAVTDSDFQVPVLSKN